MAGSAECASPEKAVQECLSNTGGLIYAPSHRTHLFPGTIFTKGNPHPTFNTGAIIRTSPYKGAKVHSVSDHSFMMFVLLQQLKLFLLPLIGLFQKLLLLEVNNDGIVM